MADREPIGWITVHGHHVPIFDKTHAFDFKQHGSMAQYIDKNRDTDFDKDTATEQFIDKTGVSVDDAVKEKCSAENLQTIYETISHIQDEYGIGILKGIREAADDDGCPACISGTGYLYINTDLYSHDKAYMDLYYEMSVESGEHVKGDSSSIIAHEMGHSLFYKSIDDSVSETGLIGAIKRDQIKKLFDGSRFNERIAKDNDAYKTFGDKLNKLLADNKPSDICKYADKDYHEMIAEAFADVYYSGRRAKKLSRLVYQSFFE